MNLTTLWREFFSGQPLWLKAGRALFLLGIVVAYAASSLVYFIVAGLRAIIPHNGR
jgi:hypothetical protein